MPKPEFCQCTGDGCSGYSFHEGPCTEPADVELTSEVDGEVEDRWFCKRCATDAIEYEWEIKYA